MSKDDIPIADWIAAREAPGKKRIEELEATTDELKLRIKQLESKLYDAYGLGLDDGIEMAEHPLGLGGKTQPQVVRALLEQEKSE